MTRLHIHHTRDLAHTPGPGTLTATCVSAQMFRSPCAGSDCRWDEFHQQRFYDTAYAWLAEQTGFWPLFATVGSSPRAEWATGYGRQFYRGASARVLFSWREIPSDAVFIDDAWWNQVLNCVEGSGCTTWQMGEIDASTRRRLLRPDRDRDAWLRAARRDPCAVQAVLPALELDRAARVCCPSRGVARALKEQGYRHEQLHTLRMRVDPFTQDDAYRFLPHAPPRPLVRA